MASLACCSGYLDQGTPAGEEAVIAGLACYVATPPTPTEAAVVICTDVFGYTLVNVRLIADAFAQEGFLAVVPDLFKGTELRADIMSFDEPERPPNFLQRLGSALHLGLLVLTDVVPFMWRHRDISAKVPGVEAVITELRQHRGIRRVGLQGYCYGGVLAVLLGKRAQLVEAVVPAHPGHLKAADLQALAVPSLFICASSDFVFTQKQRQLAQEILAGKEAEFMVFQGTHHGFAVRGNSRDGHIQKARLEALQAAASLFKKHLLTA